MRAVWFVAALATITATGCLPRTDTATSPGDGRPPAHAPAGSYRVIRVIDGDTIIVDIDGVATTSRLLGADTPELHDPRVPVQCYAQAAADRTHQLLDGTWVTLTADPTQASIDAYGRRLDYWTGADGTDIGLELISEGYALEYTYHTAYQRRDAHLAAQADAKAHGRGLWAADTCAGDPTRPAT